jgi:hypothetical protein
LIQNIQGGQLLNTDDWFKQAILFEFVEREEDGTVRQPPARIIDLPIS